MPGSTCSLSTEGNRIWLEVNGQPSIELHPLWLRERCSGKAFLDPQNLQRLYDPNALPDSLVINKALLCDSKTLKIVFSDGCTSHYAIRDILNEYEANPNTKHNLQEKTYWDRNLERLPKQAYPQDEASWLHLLTKLKAYGFVVVTGAPCTPEATLAFAESIGPIKVTNFGKIFDVYSKPKSSMEDLAYSNQALGPHTDNPYRFPAPGTQILHAIENDCEGGLSTLIDGFAVAKKLRQDHPKAFEVLSKTKVRFIFVSDGSILENWFPLIKVNTLGEPERVHFSTRVDYVPLLSKSELNHYYEARGIFANLLNSEGFTISFKLKPGNILLMNNHRVLHGRTAYKAQSPQARYLRGCYIDNDDIDGRLRALRKKLSVDPNPSLYPISH